jgi:putative protease
LREELKKSLGEVFNRGLWEGYYLGRPVVELSMNYGSSATKRKVYVGKLTNFFGNVSVAEVMVEAAPLDIGDKVVVIGQTTGVVEFTPDEIFVNEIPVETALQGKRCSIKSPSKLHRGDKLYKLAALSL